MTYDMLADIFARGGDRPALLTQDGQVLSFGKVAHTVAVLATRLRDEGVQPGQCVVPLVDNRALRIMLRFALLRLGVVVAQVDVVQPLSAANVTADAVIVFADQDATGARRLELDQGWLETAPDPALGWRAPLPMIVTTAGSTGVPRLLHLSVENLLERASITDDAIGPSVGPMLQMIPENTGVSNHFLIRAWLARHAVMGVQGTPKDTLIAAAKLGVNEILATPSSLFALLDALEAGAPKGDIARIIVCGAMPGGEVLERSAAAFSAEVIIAAGATEAGPFAFGRYDSESYEPGWSGQVHSAYEVKLRGRGEMLRYGASAGRLAIKPARESRAKGYLGDVPAFDADGFFETGDIASLTDDGALIFAGRADNLINLDGSKYSAELIELLACEVPEVAEAAAVAVRPAAGGPVALGLAVVVGAGFDAAGLTTHLKLKMPCHAPIRVSCVSALPQLPSGKLNRAALADLFGD